MITRATSGQIRGFHDCGAAFAFADALGAGEGITLCDEETGIWFAVLPSDITVMWDAGRLLAADFQHRQVTLSQSPALPSRPRALASPPDG